MLDQLLGFVQERWFVIVGAVIVLFIVSRLIKKAIKWTIILAVIAVLLIYGLNYDLSNLPELPVLP